MYRFLSLAAFASILTACSPAENKVETQALISELEKAADRHKKSMQLVEETIRTQVDAGYIIVYGQVLQDDDGAYLEAIEYLKAPDEIRLRTKLSLGEGVELGRNIPALNDMALTVFSDDMSILYIAETIRGSQNFERWRNAVHEH